MRSLSSRLHFQDPLWFPALWNHRAAWSPSASPSLRSRLHRTAAWCSSWCALWSPGKPWWQSFFEVRKTRWSHYSIIVIALLNHDHFCFCTPLFIPQSPPKTECDCLHGGVIENGCTHNPLTLCSVPALIHVQVCVHILGDPQCSAEERYNNNNTTVTLIPCVCHDHCHK